MNTMRDQELLQHFPGSDKEIAVTTLTSELKRAFHRRLWSGTAVRSGWRFEVRDDDNLEVTLDAFREREEIRR